MVERLSTRRTVVVTMRMIVVSRGLLVRPGRSGPSLGRTIGRAPKGVMEIEPYKLGPEALNLVFENIK